jgi:hypothetical protein
MPRGREPIGERPLSNAERQARYRTRRALAASTEPAVATRAHRAEQRPSRPRRWRAAVAELLALQSEYAAWLDALPDSLQATPTAEALQAIVELDLDTLASIEPPRGYGRD